MKAVTLIKSHVTRRGLQISLGVLWLLDGVLQLQPQMFTSSFANQVISTAASGQPLLVSGPMSLEVHILLMHPAIFNAIFALVQLSLGALILWKPTARIGLLASVVWGLGVWYLGEGLAGMLSGQASLLMGAPGAALLYVVLALAALPPRGNQSHRQSRPAAWLTFFWFALWVGGAIFQLLPGQSTISDLSSMIATDSAGAPAWLSSLDTRAAHTISNFGAQSSQMSGMHMTASQMSAMNAGHSSGLWFVLILAALQAAIGIAVLWPGRSRQIAVYAGIVLSLVFWAVGQSFGGYYTGLATDPNSAPLFILLGVTILGLTDHGFALYKPTRSIILTLNNHFGGNGEEIRD